MRRLWGGQAGWVRSLAAVMLLLCCAVPAHAAFGDCADPTYRARFDPRLENWNRDLCGAGRVDGGAANRLGGDI